MPDIASNLARLRDDISQTAVQAGRRPEEVRLLAVSKTFSAEAIREAWQAGQRVFGENRVQEAARKIPQFKTEKFEWHLIGHLQSNKVRPALELFSVIQSLDSSKLASRLNRAASENGRIIEVLLQINIGEEPHKFGIPLSDAWELVECVDALEHLHLGGLMCIPPYDENAESSRAYFRNMHRLFDEVNSRRQTALGVLSMGMSHDFRVAIQEGSTLVRIGTAIFGSRT